MVASILTFFVIQFKRQEAIKKYQTDNALKSTGGINAATLEKMGIALTDKQKDQVAAQVAFDAAKAPKN